MSITTLFKWCRWICYKYCIIDSRNYIGETNQILQLLNGDNYKGDTIPLMTQAQIQRVVQKNKTKVPQK